MLSYKPKMKAKFVKNVENKDGVSTPKIVLTFDWKDALLDSIIYASGFGIGSLVTGIADGGLSALDLQITLLLFSGSFVAFLRVKRNIPKEVNVNGL